MSGTPSNKGRKNADSIREKIKAKKDMQSDKHELAIQQQLQQKKILFNLNQSLIIIYIMFGEMIVIIAIVERITHKVIYGSSDYGRLDSNWFYTHSGQKCLSTNTPNTTYHVSTPDGINFSFVKPDGTVGITFESLLTYPELAGQSQEIVLIDKVLYDPMNQVSDEIKSKSVKDPNATPEMMANIQSLLDRLVLLHSENTPYYQH